MDMFLALLVLGVICNAFGEEGRQAFLFFLIFLPFMSFCIELAPYGFSMGQVLLLCVGILFVLIFGVCFALKMFDYAAEKRREKNQIKYEANYAKQKELYLRTGKVSNWDQGGRNLFDFEVKGSPFYIDPTSPPPSDRLP